MRVRNRWVLAGLAVGVMCVALAANAQNQMDVSFSCVTFNNATDSVTGQAQLTAMVGKTGNGVKNSLYIVFNNVGEAPCSITKVYLDGEGVAGLEVALESEGVSFLNKVKGPRDLPGGNSIGFTADASVGAKAPVQPNGVNPGETLILIAVLEEGITPAMIFDGFANGSIRLGIHVQGFEGDGSESFTGVPELPEEPNPDE